MNWSIKNGILLIGTDRIILAHVSRWQVTQQAVVFHIHGHQNSINLGTEAAKLDAVLITIFTTPDSEKTCPTPQQ